MIVDFDSFDSYRTANIAQRYTLNEGGTIQLGTGRCGSNCLRVQTTPAQRGVLKGLPLIGPTFQFGFAVQPQSSGGFPLCVLWNGSTPIARIMFDIAGSISWFSNPDAAFPPYVWSSPGGLIIQNQWNQISVGGTLGDSGTGSLTVKSNGIVVATASGLSLTSSGDPNAFNAFELGGASFSKIILFDDYFVGDLTGSVNNTLLGDVHVQKMMLQADGAIIGWTPVGGSAPNYALVEDGDNPDISRGIESNVAGTTDVYVVEDLATVAGAEVFAVKMSELATKDASGDRSLDVVVYDGAPHTAGLPKGITQTDYQYVEHVMETDPSTAAAWTTVGFNARQIGPKIST